MENTKLIKLLKTFSKSEVNKFKEFVSSPFFNKNQSVINLNETVLSYYPGFDSKNFTEENIFFKMFGKEKFDYFKIKNIISDLYQLALSFLTTIANEKKGIENDINLLNELHERKLDNLYLQKEKQINNQLKGLLKDEFYYLNQYQLARVNTSHFKFEKSGYTFDLIQKEFDIFLRYSLISLLRNYAKMLINKNHGNIQFNLEMFENIWGYVKDKDFEDSPSCQLYKQIIALELSRNEKDFKSLMKFKENNINSLSHEDIYYTVLVSNSFTAYRLKLGDESYYKDRFNTFKEMVERNLTLKDYVLFMNFISTFTSACMVKEFKWAENFMNEYENGISPAEEKANTVNYCKGFMAYKLKEYDKALGYFARTNFKLFLAKVMVRSYTVRIFYEQNMHQQTFAAIDTFRHYLKSEKLIAEEQKIAHYEFLKHISELSKLKLENVKSNDERLFVLRKQIKDMSSNPGGAKIWLIEKTEEFNR